MSRHRDATLWPEAVRDAHRLQIVIIIVVVVVVVDMEELRLRRKR